jgi:hypothetical protein
LSNGSSSTALQCLLLDLVVSSADAVDPFMLIDLEIKSIETTSKQRVSVFSRASVDESVDQTIMKLCHLMTEELVLEDLFFCHASKLPEIGSVGCDSLIQSDRGLATLLISHKN